MNGHKLQSVFSYKCIRIKTQFPSLHQNCNYYGVLAILSVKGLPKLNFNGENNLAYLTGISDKQQRL